MVKKKITINDLYDFLQERFANLERDHDKMGIDIKNLQNSVDHIHGELKTLNTEKEVSAQ